MRVRLPPFPLQGLKNLRFQMEESHASLADRLRLQPSKLARWVRFPQGALTMPLLVFKQCSVLIQTEVMREEHCSEDRAVACTCKLNAGSSSNRKTPAPHAGNPGATPGGSTYHTAPWSNGDDTWFTSRKRRFDSVRGYLHPPRYANRQSGSA